jgi:hypothetical protein
MTSGPAVGDPPPERVHGEDARDPGHDQARRPDRAQLVVLAYEAALVRPGWSG